MSPFVYGDMNLKAHSPADVRRAVRIARSLGARVAVRATGHGAPAELPAGTLLVDTCAMRTVLVDPDRRTARIGPGATWGDVVAAAAPFGLAPVTGTDLTVGVAGFTFGGGHGFLARKFGLGADNLLRADVVTADGELITATAERRSELFWALRGAGGNFGVATAVEVRLHPVKHVFGGSATFDRGLAPHLLQVFAEYAQPDDLNVSIVLTDDAVAVRGAFAGGADKAWAALAPLFPDEPLTDTFRAMPVAETETIGGTRPLHFELLRDVPVDAILQTAATATEVEIKRWGGAIARGTTPAGHRHVPFSVTVNGPSIAPLKGHVTGGSFLNWCHDPARVADAYTASDLSRLQELKHAYDPHNVFGAGRDLAVIPTATRSAA